MFGLIPQFNSWDVHAIASRQTGRGNEENQGERGKGFARRNKRQAIESV